MVFSFQCFVPPEEMKMSLEEESERERRNLDIEKVFKSREIF